MFLPRIFGILLVLTGCMAAPAKRPVLTPNGGTAATWQSTHFPDGKSDRARSHTLDFPIELMLPEKGSWRLSDGPNWLEAEHAASSSKLAVRTWRAERLVRRTDCAAQARLARPSIPIVNEESVIDQRAFAAPRGFDSELVVGVEPSNHGVVGYALVFGASVGYCYAAVFTTMAEGSGADQDVAARLGIAVDRVLSSVHTRSVEDRAARRRLVVSPKASPSAAPSESK
jgi:hypothetical protein